MFKIVYSPDVEAGENYFKNQITKCLENDEKLWILVPEQFSLTAERSVVFDFNVSAQKNIKVITFSRLCNLIFSELGPLRLKYIDGAGKQIIAARTVRELKEKATVLKKGFTRRGFSGEIVKLVSELKRYGVTAETLRSASSKTDNADFSSKLSDISDILDAFNEFTDRQYSDSEDNLSLVIPKIKNCGFIDGTLLISHFRSFTPVEFAAISELMEKTDITAIMCCDGVSKSSALFGQVAATCRELYQEAEKRGVATVEPKELPLFNGDKELDFLRRNYFSNKPTAYDGDVKSVEIFEVQNNYRELECVADLILRLLRTENRNPSDFLILARNPEEYNRIMPVVFASRGLDVFLDTSRSILTKPYTTMLSATFDILAFGYSYERVMAIARSGFADITDKDADIFENYLLYTAPTPAVWDKKVWDYEPKGYDINQINSIKDRVLKFPKAISEKIKGRKTAKDIVNAVIDAVSECNITDLLNKICADFEEDNIPYLADEYKQVYNGVTSVLFQTASLMDDEYITWRDFADLFKSAVGGLSVGITPKTQGSVTFSGIDRFRSVVTPVVIVLGMNDGVFPRAHTSEGIISDSERSELDSLGVHLAPGADFKQKEEQLLIHSVLSSAKEHLYFFVPLYNTDGSLMSESTVIRKIKTKLMPKIPTYIPDFDREGLFGAEGKEAVFGVLCSYLANADGNPDKLSSDGRYLFDIFKNNEYKDRLNGLLDGMARKTPEKLSREMVKELYGEELYLSASKLEQYNSCAFSYFMRYGLLAKEREESAVESKDTGTIQHNALCTYFTELKAENVDYNSISKDECFERVYKIVKDEAIKKKDILYESSAYYRYIVTRMQGIAARTAWETVKFYKACKFRPEGLEIRIDTNGEIPLLNVVDNDNKSIAKVRGIIDRADMAELDGTRYISVIDYKSSKKELDVELSDEGINIQPLLYMDMLSSYKEATPAAMMYMQMTDPIIKEEKLNSPASIEREISKEVSLCGWIADDEAVVNAYGAKGENGENFMPSKTPIEQDEILSRIERANKKIQEAAIGIYNGNIDINPFSNDKFDACRYCPFDGCCGNKK